MIYELSVTDREREFVLKYSNDGKVVFIENTNDCLIKIDIPRHILEKFIEMIK